MPTNTLHRATRVGSDVAEDAADEFRGVASTAATRGGALVESAREETWDLAGSVRDQAGEVSGEVVAQTRNVIEETRSQLETRAADATQRLAFRLRDFGEQAQALTEGRTEDAPNAVDYVGRAADGLYGAADRLSRVSEDIEQRGVSGALEDLECFARRRPGAFLLGAVAVGFGVGRAIKAQKQGRDEQDEQDVPRAQNGARRPGRYSSRPAPSRRVAR